MSAWPWGSEAGNTANTLKVCTSRFLVNAPACGMEGYELAVALRAAFPDDPPGLVALTGYGQPHEKRKALDCGFDAHLVKPVDLGQLHSVIDKLLAVESK